MEKRTGLTHIFGAAAIVGLGHYGLHYALTGTEDAITSLDLAVDAMIGAGVLTRILGARDRIDGWRSKPNDVSNSDQGPSDPQP